MTTHPFYLLPSVPSAMFPGLPAADGGPQGHMVVYWDGPAYTLAVSRDAETWADVELPYILSRRGMFRFTRGTDAADFPEGLGTTIGVTSAPLPMLWQEPVLNAMPGAFFIDAAASSSFDLPLPPSPAGPFETIAVNAVFVLPAGQPALNLNVTATGDVSMNVYRWDTGSAAWGNPPPNTATENASYTGENPPADAYAVVVFLTSAEDGTPITDAILHGSWFQP